MSTPKPTPEELVSDSTHDFSLVLGGPLYQLWRRARLAGLDAHQLLKRRIAAMTLLAWVPLLVLSLVEGNAFGGVALPFLHDIEIHARLLVALPLLVLAEQVVHQRVRPVVRQFVARGIVPDTARPRFDAAIASAIRLRNSVAAEVLLIAVVYGVGMYVWRTQAALDAACWYGVGMTGKLQPSLAGWWLGCFSLPLFQFLLLRWYFRLFIWARFQWHVSRIEVSLMPMHPDRCGGLGFLGGVSTAFAPVLFAQGALLAGIVANHILHTDEELLDFKVQLATLVAVNVILILGPMCVFVPALTAAKRSGIREYGELAQRYAREFDRKWLRGGATGDAQLVGSADIQSLADLANSFTVVREMQPIPFHLRTIVHLAVVSLLPVAPLLLTMIPIDDLLAGLFRMVF